MKVKDIIGVCELNPPANIKIIGYDEHINNKVLIQKRLSLRELKESLLSKYYDEQVEAITAKDDYLLIYIDKVEKG